MTKLFYWSLAIACLLCSPVFAQPDPTNCLCPPGQAYSDQKTCVKKEEVSCAETTKETFVRLSCECAGKQERFSSLCMARKAGYKADEDPKKGPCRVQ